jgi:hypothetical protein
MLRLKLRPDHLLKTKLGKVEVHTSLQTHGLPSQ